MTPNDYMRAYALVNILMQPDCKYTDQSWYRLDKFNRLNIRQPWLDINPEFIQCFKSIDDRIAIITTIIVALTPGVIFVITGWGTFLFLFLLFTFVVSLATIVHKVECVGDLWKI